MYNLYDTQEREKRFWTRGALSSIMSSRLAKIPTFYRYWLRCLFELHRREGGLKDIHCSAPNAALFVDLL